MTAASWVGLCHVAAFKWIYQLSEQCRAAARAGDDRADYVLNLIRFELDWESSIQA